MTMAAPAANSAIQPALLGHPRLHLRSTTSTNDRARELALAGAPHGTLVTATEQTAGRGRQGRRWSAPAGSSLLMSLVLRDPPVPLSLLAAVAVCDVAGDRARVKWPNDIVVEDAPAASGATLRKLAGILVEGRPQDGWAVLGVGINVAVRVQDMPHELQATAATLGQTPAAIEPTLGGLLEALARRLTAPAQATLGAWRRLDALDGREITWTEDGERHVGRARGIEPDGRLIVARTDGSYARLSAGEVSVGTWA
jgi:BirA family biotin operon repressor/biotin-[acetyl-CoA-carboxylase] ligase